MPTAALHRRGRLRRVTLASVALGLVIAACSTTAEPVPTTAAPTTTTTSSTTTTTTTTPPSVEITVEVDGEPEIAAVLSDLYTWIADNDSPRPEMPGRLAAHLMAAGPTDGDSLHAEVAMDGVIGMGLAGVAVVEGGDIILLVNDLDPSGEDLTGWRVVGAWLADQDPWFGKTIRHVLIIGTDARDWQDPVKFRGDSLHIVSSNTKVGGGGILGFPRDSWIEAPYGMDKFTHVNALTWTESDEQVEADLAELEPDPLFGVVSGWLGLDAVTGILREGPDGGEVTTEIAEQLTGIPIEGYILTGFRDFQALITEYGSVTVDIPFGMADPSSGAFFRSGVQELWGKAALAFSRNRHLTGGDFTRSSHQGLVILARLQGVLDSGFMELPHLISGLVANTWTNLTLEQLLTLGAAALVLDPDNVGNAVVPGRVATRGGASVVLIDDSAEDLYRDLRDGVLEIDSP